MKWIKKAAYPISVASFITVLFSIIWYSFQAHNVPACLMNIHTIAAFIHVHKKDNNDPPEKLSDMSTDDWLVGEVNGLLPRASFVCPSDPRSIKAIKDSKTFYSSYHYYPGAAKSGEADEVMLYCTHHVKIIRCVNIAFGDGINRDYSLKESKQWLPDL